MSTDNDYRRVFTSDMLDDMRDIFASVCTDFEAELVEMDGEPISIIRSKHLPKRTRYLRPERRSLRSGKEGHSFPL